MEKQQEISLSEHEEIKLIKKPNYSTKKFSNYEIKKMNEIILNFQPSERSKQNEENMTDFMKKKFQRNNINNSNTNDANFKKQKKESEKNFDPPFFFDMDNQNKFADDLNVNLLKYNLTHSANNNSGNINSNNNNENINNYIGINYTSNNDENIINSYNNFDVHFNTNGFGQNNFNNFNHIEKSFEHDIIKKIVLEHINRILSGNNLKEKMMLYMIMCKSDKSCRVENESENEMDKLLEIMKANFSQSQQNKRIQTDVVRKIVLGFCKFLHDNNYSIIQNKEVANFNSRNGNEVYAEYDNFRNNSESPEGNDYMKNKVNRFYFYLVCN
jgi:hypothetical protein